MSMPFIPAGEVAELDADRLDALIAGGGTILVDLWASWCGPCRSMLPVLDVVAAERSSALSIVKLQIDAEGQPQNGKWAQQFGVQSVPTFILFKDGEDIAGFAGTATPAQLRSWLDEHLG